MLAALFASLVCWQDPEGSATPADHRPSQPVIAVEAWDDQQAKAAVEAWTKAQKGTPSLAEKHRALEQLATGSHKLLVKPLAQLIETDKSLVVRKRAATLLGNQPAAEATPALRRLLKAPQLAKAPTVAAELVRSLARCGYSSAHWNDIADLFEREYHTDRVPLQEAILELVAQHREAKALPILLRNLDEPTPANVNDASNPPAEYWEARWKSWAVWRGKVKDALFAVTGQRFSTADEAKAWLKKNPLK